MADPLNPETELDLTGIPENEQKAIDALFVPTGPSQEEQEVQSLFSNPSVNLAQAQNLISVRDNPKSVDIIGGLATRLKEGKLPFNKQSFSDLQDNVSKYSIEANPKLLEAEKKGDWLGMTKLSLGGVGKVLGASFQAGLGITNEEAEITRNSFAARNYIGTIKDPAQAAKALELRPLYEDELASGNSIVPKDEKPAMAFGKGPFTVKLGMNLAMAENYLRDLQSDRAKKLGTASLRNFAIQSGDAFLPFVSIGDIVVDENDPDLVARRSALSNAINDTIQKDYMGSTLAGAAIGSVGSFITVGGAATKILGRAAQIGDRAIKVPTVLSRGATYATIGASQSFEGDPRDLSIAQRLSSVFSEGAILGLAEGAGNKLEESIDAALANHVAAKALATKLPALAPLVGSTGKVVGTTLGETASEEIEAILRGQDPVEPLLQNLAVSGGIGLGMALPGFARASFAERRAKIYAMADDRFVKTLEQTVSGIKTDSSLNDEQKARQINELRLSLPSPKAQALFDAVNVKSSIDRVSSPKSAQVADEAVESAKQNSVESMLSAKLTEAEGQIGTPTVVKTEAPETEEEKLTALNELIDTFNKGATSIALSNIPANASKIQWLEGQGRIVGGLSEDGKTYSVTNVKTDAGDWLNGTPAIEFNQDLKDQLILRGEEIGIEQDELDQMNSELEKAGTDADVEEVARKYLGPTDYELALETKLASSQELIAEEKPAEINAQKLQAQINVLESKIKEVPEEEKVVLQEQIDRLKAMSVEGQAARLVRGEESVLKLVKQFEGEAASDIKAGKLSPELEASPNVVLPQNDPESEFFAEHKKRQLDPRENNREALGSVFNLKNPATVELLQSLGAIDENGRNILTPVETLAAYIDRKKSYLEGEALAGYRRYEISDQVSLATSLSFLDELRKGKSDISLSILFNSRLRNFIEKAVPRMRAGVGQGAAISLETPGLRVGAVDAETLAEEQGINPAVAGAINETLDQIDATEIDNQIQSPSDVPSQSQRQEALAILGQNLVAPFRESLATEGEKLAFDSVTSGKATTAQDAAKVGTTIDNINALKAVVKSKFVSALEAEYRKNQQAGTLPSREVAEPEGLVKAGNLTQQQIKPIENIFKKYQADSIFDDAELNNAKALLDQVRNTRSVQMLNAFENYINSVASDKISPEGITDLAEAIDSEIQAGVKEESLSEKQSQDYISKLNKLAEPYLASQVMEEGEAKNKIAINFRSNLLKISEQVANDRGFNIPEGETNEQPISKPEAKTTDDRRAEASKNFPQNESKRASTANRIPGQTIPPVGKEVGRATTGATVGAGRPGVEIARGTPVPKSFVESRAQVGKVYDEKILAPIGSEVLNLLSPEQRQDTAAAITSIEGSSSKSFYLANGPGTGKTRVLLAAGKYYLDKGFNVFYLTAPDAITPDWDQGTIGGTITKDAGLMGVPIVARGGKGNNNRGLPIEKVPGKIVVSTYTSQYLEQLIPLVDSKTVVIFDEQHSGRNLHKAVQEGKTRAWAILMNEISLKAGRVLMASGTPFETPDQLLSLGRLGIFNLESPDALIKRLGFEKQYLRGGKKSYWVLSPGVTETEMQDRLETYLDGLVKNGILRSRSLKLDGVKVEFQDVPLDAIITKRLEDIKTMYGGEQNNSISALRQLVAAQKRALEEYKVNAAAARAIKSIRQGRKPVIYVGFVSETNARGESVDPTSAAVEAELLRLNPDLKIAKMYTGSGQTKEQALAAFNEGDADVLIATKEMGGTGIELDDKFGDQPRDMIIMSSPVSAIQAVQLIYRVWRGDSASRPNLIFLESKAEVDQYNIDRMRAKLRLLDATTSAGFEGLKAEEAVAPVRSDEATPEQIAETEETLQSVLGGALSNNVITLRDEKGGARTYNIRINPGAENLAAAMPGDSDESDTIILNPEKLAEAKKLFSLEAFKSYLTKMILEETIHVETYRYFRELGLNAFEEISAIGEGLSQAARLAIARLYYSNFGSDITNPAIQSKIRALANDPYLVAMEGIRQLAQLELTGGVTEQAVGRNQADIDRATSRLKDIIKGENKSTSKRISIWLDGMATVIKRGIGLAPNAKDRLAVRPSIEASINRLRQTSRALANESNISPAAAPAPGISPTAPRPATVFDSYDLRVYRMIENYLGGKTGEVLGITAADDLFKTVKVSDWLDALDINTRRGAITKDERSLFRAATQAVMEGGQASLPAIANKALEIAEGMEEAGKSLPVAAFVATSAPAEVVNASQSFEEEPTYQEYRVKIPGSTTISTTAISEAKAVSNAAIRLFERQEVVNYNGGRYTNPAALIAALRDTGYAKFAKPTSPAPETVTKQPIAVSVSLDGEPILIPVSLPEVARVAPAPAPEIRESKAVKNIIATFNNALPEGEIKDKILSQQNYQSVSNPERIEDGKSYVEEKGLQTSIMQFLGGTIKGPLPFQQAVGFEIARLLDATPKTDLYSKKNQVDVMLLLSKKYGTETGQSVSLWKSLGELSNNPAAMKMFVGRQLDSSVKGRLSGYAKEEAEIADGLREASRRAVEKLLTSPKSKSTLEMATKLIEINKRQQSSAAGIETRIASHLDSDEAASDGLDFLGEDLAAAPEVGGSASDDIRLNPAQTKALSKMILDLIQLSDNPSVLAASEEEIKRLLLLTKTLRNAKNQDNIRRKLDLYFDASLAHALEIFSNQVLDEGRAKENIQPPATRGEAIDRVYGAKAKVKARAPVSIEQGIGDGSLDHALLDAAANSLQQQAERLQEEPKVKTQIEVLVGRIKGYIATNTKAAGGLQPAYEPLPKPTQAEVFRDLVANHPQTMEIFDGIRDSLRNNFSEEELGGLEPFIEKVFDSPYTQSSLKSTIRTLESIGGPKTNIQGLIRSSRGDIMTFENELGALLTKNTNLNEAQKKEVTDFLRNDLTALIAGERKLELEKIKKRFEAKKERKTRKMRSGLDKLIEASNLGVLNDDEVFIQMHTQLGLPELSLEARAHLNKLIEDLPLYPEGMIRNAKISQMYGYVKLVAPQVWGELIVNYQTSNLLSSIGTFGINVWSSSFSLQLNAGILAAVGVGKGDKNRARGYRRAALALNASIFVGEKPALKAARNIFLTGDYSGVQDALTQELGGVNLWEAILSQAEDYRSGKKGATKPELPVNILGQEYRIPLDSKYISSKYGALAPFIFFGRAMAGGDALNRISSRKMYEMAEATNIAIEKGFKTEEEVEAEVTRLLNQSPEARARAEAKAENEAKEFGLTPDQQSLRVEEIIDQGRPDEQEVKKLIEKATDFAARSTFTNNYEGYFGLVADTLSGMGNQAWQFKLVLKFLKTSSSLANEVLNFLPLMSNIRLIRGSAGMLKKTKYYRPPPVPGSVDHDLALGKMIAGNIITIGLLTLLREAIGGEDDPYFNIHFKGSNDQAQREAFQAANGKYRAIQVGRFRDGKPQFISFEFFPVGLTGPLILAGAIVEAIRYEKRAAAESIITGIFTGGALAMYGILDMASLASVRGLMSLTSPGAGQNNAKGIMGGITKTVGNIASGLIPGYATFRDVEQLWNGVTQAPSARIYKDSFLANFAQSVPFASKVGRHDLDFLGGNIDTQLMNTIPFVRRLTTTGVVSTGYDKGDRTSQAVHNKLIALFASNRYSLDWSPGPLSDLAIVELVQNAAANGIKLEPDDFFQISRELTPDERYEWMQKAGPAIQNYLAGLIPQLEKMSRPQFVSFVQRASKDIKGPILRKILFEKNQEGILYPENK